MTAPSLSPPFLRFGATALLNYQFTYCSNIPTRSKDPLPLTSTATMDKHARAPIGLLELPPEIRRIIYHQLGFSTNHRRKIQTSRYASGEIAVRASYFFQSGDGQHNQRGIQRPLRPFVRGKGIATPIMRVCKRLANETYELLYGDTNFGIGWDMATERGWSVGKNMPSPCPDNPLDALPFAPEPYPTFLGPRAMSFLTHITLGPLSHPDYADPLDIYIRMLDYIAFRCRKLQFLGIHLSDKCKIPTEGAQKLEALIDAISNIMRCCKIQRIWFGSAKYAHDNLDVDVTRRLVAKNQSPKMDEILATARRRQSEKRIDLITADRLLTTSSSDNELRRTNFEKVVDNDYRVRGKKQQVMAEMDHLLCNWRRDMNANTLSWIPQTVVAAMNLQLSSYNQVIAAQENLATCMLTLQLVDAVVEYIVRQRERQLKLAHTAQQAIDNRLRAVLDLTNKTLEAGIQPYQKFTQMTALLPEALAHLPPAFDPVFLEVLPSPFDLPISSTESTTMTETAAHRQRFMELRKSVVSAAQNAQKDGPDRPIERMTALEARQIVAEQIGKLMSNMGFKTAPANELKAGAGGMLGGKIVPTGYGPGASLDNSTR